MCRLATGAESSGKGEGGGARRIPRAAAALVLTRPPALNWTCVTVGFCNEHRRRTKRSGEKGEVNSQTGDLRWCALMSKGNELGPLELQKIPLTPPLSTNEPVFYLLGKLNYTAGVCFIRISEP